MLYLWLVSASMSEPVRPHTVWAQLHEARLLSEFEGEHEEAIGVYDALLDGLESSEFSYGELWYWKGMAFIRLGQYDDAIECFLRSQSTDTSNRVNKGIEEAKMLKQQLQHLPSSENAWVSLNESLSVWGMSLHADASGLQGLELTIRTVQPVVSLQLQIEAWDGRIWGHAVNLIEGESMFPIRLSQLRPSVPPQTPIRSLRISGFTPAGDEAMIDILMSSSY
ncbi:MAG: tetratricopeptide repeat protein [Myxococcota bacterium]|nr:tetratricopeptide repeat protein [Myxococcota bacterium]MEC8380471.1 tetratricopeptide repeat protein [Myxococcota bacterium]